MPRETLIGARGNGPAWKSQGPKGICLALSPEKRWRCSGMTLPELLISTALGSLVAIGLMSLILFTGRSFAGMANYVDLDHRSRIALDSMSREIRQVNRLTDATTTSLTFEDHDGGELRYVYSPQARTLTRIKNGASDPEPLLTECDSMTFLIFQRNPVGGTYDQYATANPSNCKLVQLKWVCSRKVLGAAQNTESVQSAKIVIRKQ